MIKNENEVMRTTTILLAFALLLSPIVVAQTQPSTPHTQNEVSAGPAITQYSLTPDKLAKAKALYTTRIVLEVVGTIWGFVVLIAFLYWRVGPRFRTVAETITRRRFLQAWIYVPLLLLALSVLNLPLEIYGHKLSLSYGLSVQRWGSWFGDWVKSQLVMYIIASLVLWLLYRIVQASPQRSWFYFWLAFLPISLFLVFIAPSVIDPLFNKFEPLEKTQPELVQQIERVTQRGGMNIPPTRMFEMKASEKVTTYNAYVTGFGSTKRVVVWDNTARELTIPETLFVFGHEMGHYVLNHIWKGMAFMAVLTFFLFYLVYSMVSKIIERWGESLRIRSLDDWASLPLIFLVGGVIGFFSTPASAGFSRYIEHQADIYGLEVTHGLTLNSSQVAASSFQKLGEKSLDHPYPNPLLVWWTYDHPDIASRVQFALHYRPWDAGERTNFVK